MIKTLIILLFCPLIIVSQEYGISAGVVYGGPIPTEMDSKSYGSAGFGPHLGFSFKYKLSENFGLLTGISASVRSVDYGSKYRKDTTVQTTISGQTGDVNTFYTAKINSEMTIFYLDFPIFLSYNFTKKSQILIGIQPSFNILGKNDVNLKVVIGEGGFIDDIQRNYDNYGYVKRFDFALALGGRNQLSSNWFLRFFAIRSVITLFSEDFKPNPEVKVGKLYNTHFFGGIEYIF